MVSQRRPRAYSLVELMVAVAVLTFGLAAIYGQFRDTRQPSQRRLQLAKAQFHAQQILSESLAASYADLKAWKPAPSFADVDGDPSFKARTSIDQVGGNGLEVVVQVGWGDAASSEGQDFPEGQLVTVKGFRAK